MAPNFLQVIYLLLIWIGTTILFFGLWILIPEPKFEKVRELVDKNFKSSDKDHTKYKKIQSYYVLITMLPSFVVFTFGFPILLERLQTFIFGAGALMFHLNLFLISVLPSLFLAIVFWAFVSELILFNFPTWEYRISRANIENVRKYYNEEGTIHSKLSRFLVSLLNKTPMFKEKSGVDIALSLEDYSGFEDIEKYRRIYRITRLENIKLGLILWLILSIFFISTTSNYLKITDNGIVHNSFFGIVEDKYFWNDVARVAITSEVKNSSDDEEGFRLEKEFRIYLTDGKSVNIFTSSPPWGPTGSELLAAKDILERNNVTVEVDELSDQEIDYMKKYLDTSFLEVYVNIK